MLSRVYSVGVRGVEGYPVLVELDMANGLPSFTTVGLPDSAVRESRERVASAVRNSGFKFPARRITVNLAPAQSRKQGTQFDLPIALAVLSASGQLPAEAWAGKYCFVGELSLDGGLRPVNGALSMAIQAKQQGFDAIIVPAENAQEAAAVGITTYASNSLGEVVAFINGGELVSVSGRDSSTLSAATPPSFDLSDVRGQHLAKRALEVAAAGGHNILFIGPPGAGKTMLARRLPGILPPMSEGERLEVTRIHSSLGGRGLVTERPFRAPHHTASASALVGGGPAVRPGEASLAHGGVLFLDEVAEFQNGVLEALRQPLEDHKVTVTRAREALSYPARFQLVAAANPCPCGWRGHEKKECRCTPKQLETYFGGLSGPLLDRIDIHVELSALGFKDWASRSADGESSAVVRERVVRARELQRRRFPTDDFAVNAYLSASEARRHCGLKADGLALLERAADAGFSARALDRALRVARTIADLEGAPDVVAEHVGEAIGMRGKERRHS